MEAQRLRRAGWSLRWIADALGVSLSSASVWTRDVYRTAPPPPSELRRLTGTRLPVWRTGLVRRCSKCASALPLECFGQHGAGRQWWCRRCFREYHKHHRERAHEVAAARRERARELVRRVLGERGCSDCGLREINVLEFDHLGDKTTEVSVLVARGSREPRLLE
jgi:hypothetical protein